MKKIKEIILNNLHLKILSLLVAFLLWLNIASMQKTKISFFSEVKVINLPEKIKIERIEPKMVLVEIEGTRTQLNRLNISEIRVYVDGRRLKPGKNFVKVYINKKITDRFDSVSIKPERVYVYTSLR